MYFTEIKDFYLLNQNKNLLSWYFTEEIKDMPPVKDETIREINCLDINIVEKSPAKNSALVDVRACNKPATKVSLIKQYLY